MAGGQNSPLGGRVLALGQNEICSCAKDRARKICFWPSPSASFASFRSIPRFGLCENPAKPLNGCGCIAVRMRNRSVVSWGSFWVRGGTETHQVVVQLGLRGVQGPGRPHMPLLAPQHPLNAPREASVSLILPPNRSKEGGTALKGAFEVTFGVCRGHLMPFRAVLG